MMFTVYHIPEDDLVLETYVITHSGDEDDGYIFRPAWDERILYKDDISKILGIKDENYIQTFESIREAKGVIDMMRLIG